MTAMTETASRAEHLTRQVDQGRRDPLTLAWAAESTYALATALQAEVDDYLQTCRELSSTQREQLQHGARQTARAAVQASLYETPEGEAIDYLKEAVRTAQETMTLLET